MFYTYSINDRSKGWKGWLEDRRPASNGDPYKIAARIIKTVNLFL
jgi:glutamine synthetase